MRLGRTTRDAAPHARHHAARAAAPLAAVLLIAALAMVAMLASGVSAGDKGAAPDASESIEIASTLASIEPDDGFGHARVPLALGDDAGEFAVAAPSSGMNAPRAGRVYILRAPGVARSLDIAAAWAQDHARLTLAAAEPHAAFGSALLALPQWPGDPWWPGSPSRADAPDAHAPALLVGAPLALGRAEPAVVAPHEARSLWAGDEPPVADRRRLETARGRVYIFSTRDGALLRTLAGRAGDTFGVLIEPAEGFEEQSGVVVGALFLDDAFNVRLRRQVFSARTGELLVDPADDAAPIVRLAADLNADGVVDADDLAMLLERFGDASRPGARIADLNRDGVVDELDLAILVEAFGETPDEDMPDLAFSTDCYGQGGGFNADVIFPVDCDGQDGGDGVPGGKTGTTDPGGPGGDGGGGSGPGGTDPDDDGGDCELEIQGIPDPPFVVLPALEPEDPLPTITLTAAAPGEGTWLWTVEGGGAAILGGATADSVTFSYSQPGPVSVTVTFTRDDGVVCEEESGFEVILIGVEILNGAHDAAEFLRIGHWGATIANGSRLSGYDEQHNLFNGPDGVFIDTDPDRFFVRITDPRRSTNPNEAQTITALIGTLALFMPGAAIDDPMTEFDLLETGPNTGVFLSESMLLMSPDLPINPDDQLQVWSARANGFVADNARNDRTHRAGIDGTVRVRYDSDAGERSLTVPVSNRAPEERRIFHLRIRVHLEPYLDTGIPTALIPPEYRDKVVGLRADSNGQLEHMVYEFEPEAQTIGADDGWFTFVDTNGNLKHDPGEVSERYLDLSALVLVQDGLEPEQFYFRGDENDSLSGDGWGGLADMPYVFTMIQYASAMWAQAGIRPITYEGPLLESAPSNPLGDNIIYNGFFNTLVSGKPGLNHHTQVMSLVGADTTVVEIIFTAIIRKDNGIPAGGLASIPRSHADLPLSLQDNTYIFVSPDGVSHYTTLAHEIGHALTNHYDTDTPPYIFSPAMMSFAQTDPSTYRRITHGWESSSRQPRTAGHLEETGNLLLIVP